MTIRNSKTFREHNWHIGDLVQVKCFLLGEGRPMIDLRDPPDAMLIKGVVVQSSALEINGVRRPRLWIMLSTGDEVCWVKDTGSDTCVELVCSATPGQ